MIISAVKSRNVGVNVSNYCVFLITRKDEDMVLSGFSVGMPSCMCLSHATTGFSIVMSNNLLTLHLTMLVTNQHGGSIHDAPN